MNKMTRVACSCAIIELCFSLDVNFFFFSIYKQKQKQDMPCEKRNVEKGKTHLKNMQQTPLYHE